MAKENVLTLDGGEIVARKIKITDLKELPDSLQPDMVLVTDSTGEYVLLQDKNTFGGDGTAMGNLDGGTADSPEAYYTGIGNIDAGGI